MKRVLIAAALVLGFAASASAGWFGDAIMNYTVTKDQTVTVRLNSPIVYMQKTATSVCVLYLMDKSGGAYPIVAAQEYSRQFPPTVTSVIFSCVSSAGNGIAVVK